MKPFFITGLPRTRTAWMANLFTTEQSHCYHEWLAYNESGNMRQAFENVGKEYVGNSDCGFVLFPNVIEEYFSNSPVVFIERPMDEVIAALLKTFSDAKKSQTINTVHSLNDMADKIKQRVNTLVVQFKSLGEIDVIKKIWNHCIPTIPLDEIRLNLLQQLKTTVKYTSYKEGEFRWLG